MADWRQIQARIRKAKAGTDAAAKLADLYERTRDAMVAFELAQWQEKAGEHAEAARWYTAAAERFRRSQWKTKAEAALARLRSPGATPPVELAEHPGTAATPASSTEPLPDGETPQPEIVDESQLPVRAEAATESEKVDQATDSGVTPATPIATGTGGRPARRPRRRSRGRGDGRNRGRGRTGAPETSSASSSPSESSPPPSGSRFAGVTSVPTPAPVPSVAESAFSPASASSDASPDVSSVAAWRARSRAGDPALASRMAQLESQLRRLLACPQVPLDQAESAPAGPGVLLLSDSDQVSHYYVESCQTLRIAIGNLMRGGRGAKEAPRLKERLADNLGIAESRVAAYLKQHCAVRWLQLDDGAAALAHFAIAVLKPVVND